MSIRKWRFHCWWSRCGAIKEQKQVSETILEQDDNDEIQIDNSKIENCHNDSDEEEVTMLQNAFVSATSSNNKITSKLMEIVEDNDSTKSKKQKNANDIVHNFKKMRKKLKKRNQKKQTCFVVVQ